MHNSTFPDDDDGNCTQPSTKRRCLSESSNFTIEENATGSIENEHVTNLTCSETVEEILENICLLPNEATTSTDDFSCCSDNCWKKIPTPKFYQTFNKFQNDNKHSKLQFVITELKKNVGKGTAYFIIEGQEVCYFAWLNYYGISTKTFIRAIKLRQCNIEKIIWNHQKNAVSHKSFLALTWMKNFFKLACEKLPDKLIWHLPSCYRKQEVFNIYVKTVKDVQVKKSMFHKLWQDNFPYVKIPQESRFSKCDFCEIMKEEMLKPNDPVYTAEIAGLKQRHQDLQMREREAYYEKMRDAIANDKEKLSIIMDGMDQSKLTVPRLKKTKKCTENKIFMLTHLLAGKAHGKLLFGIFDVFNYKHDPNLTCNALVKMLLSLDYIPKTLYLQMDNCARDNKNKYVLSLLKYFVEKGIFKKIYVSFLMVGHTHEDIDQVFSRFLTKFLRQKDVLTLDDLMNCWIKLADSYNLKQKGVAVLAEKMYDYKAWLQPLLNPIRGHTKPHSFLIEIGENEKPIIKYKQWSSTTEEFKPPEGIELFKTFPTDLPNILKPVEPKIDIEIIKQNINSMIESTFIDNFDQSAKDWWFNFWPKLDELFNKNKTHEGPHDLELLLEKVNNQNQPVILATVPISNNLLRFQEAESAIDNPIVEMSIQRKETNPVEISTNLNYEIGQLAAIFQNELVEWLPLPIIGKIVEISFEDEKQWIKIEIFKGAYDKPWTEKPEPVFEWVEDIGIILNNFEFVQRRKKNYLLPTTADFLRTTYCRLLQQLNRPSASSI